MSTRTIASPGVSITELDLSTIARNEAGNNVFMTGFASQGPTDEIINISSVSELETVFGLPRNEAERYFHHSARQILTQSPANLMLTRMPYGANRGDGFANKYSALVFPISGYKDGVEITKSIATSAVSLPDSAPVIFSTTTTFTGISAVNSGVRSITSLDSSVVKVSCSYQDADLFSIGAPKSLLLNEEVYYNLTTNDVAWVSAYDPQTATNSENELMDYISNGGIIVLNPSKLSINHLNEGYYVAIADNSNNNPNTIFDCVQGIKSVSDFNLDNDAFEQEFSDIPQARLSFNLMQNANSPGMSISQIIENFPTGYDFGSSYYDDCLTLMVFKIRTSIYAQDSVHLDYTIANGFTGSLYNNRTQNNDKGGAPITFNLQKITEMNQSSDVKVIVNPYISQAPGWLNEAGEVQKVVRVTSGAKNLYAHGVYAKEISSTGGTLTYKEKTTELGDVPSKLQRVLNRLDDKEIDIDVIAEAGLGSVWALAKAKYDYRSENNLLTEEEQGENGAPYYEYDHSFPVPRAALNALSDADNEGSSDEGLLQTYYSQVANEFISFTEAKKRFMFIADPLRCVFINGKDSKISARPAIKISEGNYDEYVFSKDIYWSLRNLYSTKSSSYCATYGNWIKTYDQSSGHNVWLPPSGYVVADIVQSAATAFPWSAPAGFSRGVLTNVLELAINPTQKQRDLLYKININPIAFFPGDGYVIFGQKTLYNKPSAFDRINVRRLFLTLEKATEKYLKYFVFEPNTYATRARLVQSLSPIFSRAKNNDGVYDYKIICDERNNTPDVIDNNELKIAIYIQPVRTAEFILADFIATRTGVNFNEITA